MQVKCLFLVFVVRKIKIKNIKETNNIKFIILMWFLNNVRCCQIPLFLYGIH